MLKKTSSNPIWSVTITPSGKKAHLSTEVSLETLDKMEKYGPILVSEKLIKKSTPYAVTQFCIETMMKSLEKRYARP